MPGLKENFDSIRFYEVKIDLYKKIKMNFEKSSVCRTNNNRKLWGHSHVVEG